MRKSAFSLSGWTLSKGLPAAGPYLGVSGTSNMGDSPLMTLAPRASFCLSQSQCLIHSGKAGARFASGDSAPHNDITMDPAENFPFAEENDDLVGRLRRFSSIFSCRIQRFSCLDESLTRVSRRQDHIWGVSGTSDTWALPEPRLRQHRVYGVGWTFSEIFVSRRGSASSTRAKQGLVSLHAIQHLTMPQRWTLRRIFPLVEKRIVSVGGRSEER